VELYLYSPVCKTFTKFLNFIENIDLPRDVVKLKIGAPVLCLRKLESADTVYGTTIVVMRLHNFIVEAAVIAGHAAGEHTFQEYP
jgi:hypothetical protein